MANRRHPAPVRSGSPTRSRNQPLPEQATRRGLPVRLLLLGGGVLAGVLFVGAAFLSDGTAPANYACGEVLPAPSGSVGAEGITTESLGADHVAVGTRITYGFCPPTSGDHFAAQGRGPIRPGFYGPDSAAEPGGWVHNLEHGYGVVLYRGDANVPQETLAALRQFAGSAPQTQGALACGYATKTVVARFDEMSTPFAVLAWDRLLPLPAWDEAAARAFLERSMEVTAPEPAAC